MKVKKTLDDFVYKYLTEENIKKLKETRKIGYSTPKINHNGNSNILVLYNNSAGVRLYEFDKKLGVYVLKRDKDIHII